MKKQVYLLALLCLVIGFSSCKKEDDEPAPLPEVVGKWEIDYGILSGLTTTADAPFQNGDRIDPHTQIFWQYDFPLSTIHVINDKNLFVNIYKPGVFAYSFTGTWDYTSPSLILKYDEANISDETYTYGLQDGLEQLSTNESLTDSTGATVGQIQWVYHK